MEENRILKDTYSGRAKGILNCFTLIAHAQKILQSGLKSPDGLSELRHSPKNDL
jgi:hypothetical protein